MAPCDKGCPGGEAGSLRRWLPPRAQRAGRSTGHAPRRPPRNPAKALDTGVKHRSAFSGVVAAGAQSSLSRVTAHVSQARSGGGDQSDPTEVPAQTAAPVVLHEARGEGRGVTRGLSPGCRWTAPSPVLHPGVGV